MDAGRTAALLRQGLVLDYLTLGRNVVGAAVVLAAAVAARSVALASFGVDSLIEIFASAVVVWRLTGAGRGREARALRLIGAAVFAIAAFVAAQAASTLAARAEPAASAVGIGWTAATVVAMLALARGKRRTGRRLGNAVLTTEARVTLIDGLLAAAVLTGLSLNAALGWWWVDPLAGLVVVCYGIREGLAVWRARAGRRGTGRRCPCGWRADGLWSVERSA